MSDQTGRKYFMAYSKEISDEISEIVPLMQKATLESIQEAFSTMGPGCFFDDFDNATEVVGALKVFKWIKQQLIYDQDPNKETIR